MSNIFVIYSVNNGGGHYDTMELAFTFVFVIEVGKIEKLAIWSGLEVNSLWRHTSGRESRRSHSMW